MRFARTTSSTGNRGEVQCTTCRWQGTAGFAAAKFARSEVIAILTFVACAQLLTWPGLRLKLQIQKRLKRKQHPWDSPRPDSSVVERGPEKAGVGGSIPSLATTPASPNVQQRPQYYLKPFWYKGICVHQ
jgi:hypothetical protein